MQCGYPSSLAQFSCRFGYRMRHLPDHLKTGKRRRRRAGLNPSLTTLPHSHPSNVYGAKGNGYFEVSRGGGKGRVKRAHKGARHQLRPQVCELTEDGDPNSSSPNLPTPTEDLAAKLAAADATISGIEELLGKLRASQNEVRQSLNDLKREHDEWRDRAERHTERPWWRRLAG